MPVELAFVEATPAQSAAGFAPGEVHLWRLPYAHGCGRAPLLRLLAAYLHTEPDRFTLDEGMHGKPHLVSTESVFDTSPRHASGPHALQFADANHAFSFNWSHSGDYALVALGAGIDLGVDIERHDKPVRIMEIAQRFFDPAEAEALGNIDEPRRGPAFFRLWCAKEAVLKAAGEGLSFGLERLVFEPAGDGWRLRRLDPELGDTRAWQLLGFSPVAGYSGALAWRGRPRRILAWREPGPDGTGSGRELVRRGVVSEVRVVSP